MPRSTAIIAYGSLINPMELAKRQHLYSSAIPVRVKGYKRSFNQEPSWRKGVDEERAVLRVDPSEEHTFNGLLLPLENEADLSQLDEREQGYTRERLSLKQVEHFVPGTKLEFSGDIFLYAGKPEKLNPKILPNKVYLEVCLEGAKEWGEEFYRQFIKTTLINEQSLQSILKAKY